MGAEKKEPKDWENDLAKITLLELFNAVFEAKLFGSYGRDIFGQDCRLCEVRFHGAAFSVTFRASTQPPSSPRKIHTDPGSASGSVTNNVIS